MVYVLVFSLGLLVGWFLGLAALWQLKKGDNLDRKEWSKRPRKMVA